MSVEQAKAFIEKMKTDEAFREKIMAIETPEERLKAIKEAGYDCSADEVNEAGAARVEDASGGHFVGYGSKYMGSWGGNDHLFPCNGSHC
ncbi:MAG: Nif11-like leader peptide family natural product precursor [Chlorobiaceae bacterium]|nr:Nif11-like leader peptide family natural product precursor [Chlorobiaceae bacterium]